jgi:hypothetical protein
VDRRMRKWAILLLVGLVLAVLAAGCDRPAGVRPGDQSTAPLLAFARTGGIAGFQDRLVIGYGGEYYLAQAGQERIGPLSQERQDQLQAWREELAPFTLKLEDNPGGPDNMVRQLVWAGLGKANASEAKQQEILDWAGGLFFELNQAGR